MFDLGYELEPVRFWGYTSIVHDRILSVDLLNAPDSMVFEFRALENKLIKRFREAGIDAKIDNKIVFELINKRIGKSVYIGIKDWTLSVGLDMTTDKWNKPKEIGSLPK